MDASTEHFGDNSDERVSSSLGWLWAFKPFFLSRYTYLMGYFVNIIAGLVIATQSVPPLIPSFGALIIMLMAGTAVYLYNDVTDIEIDKINAPSRPLPSGKITAKEARILVTVATVAAATLSLLFNLTTLAIIVAYLAIGYAYSTPKIHLKRRLPMKTPVVATLLALSILIGGSVLGDISGKLFLAATLLFIFGLTTVAVADLKDVEGDRELGIRTLPVILGPKLTVKLSMASVFLIMGLSYLAYFLLGTINMAGPAVMSVVCAAIVVALRSFLNACDDPALCRKLEKRLFPLFPFFISALVILSL